MATNNKRRRALGRGLSNLIPIQAEETANTNKIDLIDNNAIKTNPFQPRLDFDEEEIKNLSESIKNQGLLQPVVVRKITDGYEIISGERRFRALTLNGERQIPCIIKVDVTDREMRELALVENIQRENLNEIEKAIAYNQLLEDCKMSHEELAKRIGKSRSSITNSLRLLKLPEDIQKMVRNNSLSMGHARALCAIEDKTLQHETAQRIIEEKFSVRDIESYLKKEPKVEKKVEKVSIPKDPNMEKVIEKLRYQYGTPVDINYKPNGTGKISIPYFDTHDFNRILDILTNAAS